MGVWKGLLGAVLGVALTAGAWAGVFPNRPLTMLVGYAAGGSTDIQARVLAEVLTDFLGQPVTVRNMPGAGGGVAAAMVAGSSEQGHVFQFGISSTIALTPLLVPASFNLDSFTYVAGLSLSQAAFVTGSKTGIRDWKSMVQALKRQPGRVYATQTAEDRLLIRAIAKKEGLDLRIVATSGGAGSTPMVLSGDAWLAYSGGSHADYTDSGQMHVLASLDKTRLMGYPDVPTLQELGYDLALHTIRIVTVPANTPAEQVAVLAAALERAAADPRFVDVTVNRIRQPVLFVKGADVRPMLKQQAQQFRALLADLGGPEGASPATAPASKAAR